MQIKWHGHSCFEFSDGEHTVVIDPHDGKSIGIRPPQAAADIVLMTHDHYDHNAAWIVQGDHKDHMAHNGRFESRGMQFRGLPTFHDPEQGRLRGPNTMYLFQMDGFSVCHCGDLGDIPDDQVMKAIAGVDFLFVPVGGYYTMELDPLKKFIEAVGAKIIVPMHYRVGGLTIPIASIDDFLELIPKNSIVYPGNSVDISKDEMPENKECWVFDR
jgi:L-ascorbate metabolism protein UlaG (beta-lactamase superfamily)